MRKPLITLIVLTVIFSSLVCNLTSGTVESSTEPASPDNASASQLQPVATSDILPYVLDRSTLTQEYEESLSELFIDEEILGEYYEYDYEGDGIIDDLIYSFEVEKIEDNVYVTPNLVYTQVGPDEYIRKLHLDFYNFNPDPRQVDYIYEIPKEFAAHVDELEFPVPPTEIIQPDPIIRIILDLGGYPQSNSLPGIHMVANRSPAPAAFQDDDYRELYDIVAKIHRQDNIEDAKRALLAESYQLARNICEKRTGKARNSCFLNLAVDFGRNRPLFIELCDNISDNTRLLCRAVVLGKKTCNEATSPDEREVCYAYWIGVDCGTLPLADQPACITKLAIEDKIALACFNIRNDDQINYCLAGVSRDTDYCKQIKDTELRKTCEDIYGTSKPPASTGTPQPIAPLTATSTKVADSGDGLFRTDQLRKEDCDLFIGAFPQQMEVWGRVLDNWWFGCQLDNGLELDDPAYRKAEVGIHFYKTEEEAAMKYANLYGPESESYNRTQKNIKSGTPIAVDYLGEWSFYSLRITEGRFNNEGYTRWSNVIIKYYQPRAESNSEDAWDQVVTIAKGLLESRAGP